MHDEPASDGPSQRTAAVAPTGVSVDAGADVTADVTGDVTANAAGNAATGSTTTPRKAAMDLLARREHSAQELCRKLSRRFCADEAAHAVERLSEEGLQSDERFADSFTRERFLRAYGPRRIRAELQQRGVSDALIDAALSRVTRDEEKSWTDLAREALRRRFGSRPSRDLREKARRHRFLYQRGFSPGDLHSEGLHEAAAWDAPHADRDDDAN